MDRYSIKAEEERPVSQRPAAKLTWVYWQELFNEFCLEFSYMGYRGSATIGHDRTVHIKLNTGQWSVEKRRRRRHAYRRSRHWPRNDAQIPERARKNLFVLVEQTFWQLISATTPVREVSRSIVLDEPGNARNEDGAQQPSGDDLHPKISAKS